MPPRSSIERLQRNIESLRELVDTGSPSVVRDPVVGESIGGFRIVYPLPSIGYRSGKLTVTGYIQGPRGGVASLIVQCDCGRPEYTVDKHNFKDFKSTRCHQCGLTAGQTKRYWAYIEAMPDDEHRRRLLNRIAAATNRCHNPNDAGYKNYGARGISVYEPWRLDKASFLQYVQTLPGWDIPEFEMDRINTNGDYMPGNIRFVSRAENCKNRRQVSELEAEITRLRSALRRAEEQIYDFDKLGTSDSA